MKNLWVGADPGGTTSMNEMLLSLPFARGRDLKIVGRLTWH